jgi:hypothetical protein
MTIIAAVTLAVILAADRFLISSAVAARLAVFRPNFSSAVVLQAEANVCSPPRSGRTSNWQCV